MFEHVFCLPSLLPEVYGIMSMSLFQINRELKDRKKTKKNVNHPPFKVQVSYESEFSEAGILAGQW